MSFIFKINRVDRFTDINVGVLDGVLTKGRVNRKSQAQLIHQGKQDKVHISGLLLASSPSDNREAISLTIDLRQPGMHLVKAGDLLISD